MFNFFSPLYGARPNGFYNVNMYNQHDKNFYQNQSNNQNSNQSHQHYNNDFSNISSSVVAAQSNKDFEDDFLFEIFGIKIFFDDLLIICILLFLYEEKIEDHLLYIALILLLIS